MIAPFVGPPQVMAESCAYAPSLSDGACGATPETHVLADCPWGIVGLLSCNAHASVARAAGRWLGEHVIGPDCIHGTCWDGG